MAPTIGMATTTTVTANASTKASIRSLGRTSWLRPNARLIQPRPKPSVKVCMTSPPAIAAYLAPMESIVASSEPRSQGHTSSVGAASCHQPLRKYGSGHRTGARTNGADEGCNDSIRNPGSANNVRDVTRRRHHRVSPAAQEGTMKRTESPGPVVVGIDGSKAAVNAAKWAIDEAISRDVPLRLVYVTHIREASIAPRVDFHFEQQYAEAALRQAHAAVEATGRLVKVETAVLRGDVDDTLVEESRDAA